MFNKLFKLNKTMPQEQFWIWFAERSLAYFDFEENQEPLFDDLTNALSRVQLGLTFEFGPKENGIREFVISADGDRKLFLPVTQLVKSAPPLKQWKVLAFRQRRDAECEIKINEVMVTTERIHFVLEPDGNRIGVTLYFDNYRQLSQDVLSTTAFLFLDNALGEYDVETKVGIIEHKHLHDDENKSSLSPFEKLPSAFDALYAKLHN